MHTHEEIVRVGVGPADFEKLHQVMELSMNIAANRHGAFLQQPKVSHHGSVMQRPLEAGTSSYHWLDVRFLLKDLSCLKTNMFSRCSPDQQTFIRNPPARIISGHPTRQAACSSSSSQSNRQGWER
jgi:hypothetical protein